MTKPLLLAAAAALTLSACAQPRPEPARMVFLSGPGAPHVLHHGVHRGDRTIIIRRGDVDAARAHGAAAARHAEEAMRMARLHRPDPAEIERITREARALGEEARRMGEQARLQGHAARLQGEEARRMGEAARARGEAIRRDAERLREQCERGEIKCEIIVVD